MSIYQEKLNAICADIESMPGTGGARALRSIVMDLNSNGPVGELLHSLDQERFEKVIDLFIEFKRTGRRESFNAIHAAARARVADNQDDMKIHADDSSM